MNSSRRNPNVSLVLIVVVALVAVFIPATLFAQTANVDICHLNDEGDYNLINVSVSAEMAHIDHGDGYPGGDVPNMPSYLFDEACTPAPLPAGCYYGYPYVDLWYDGAENTIGNIWGTYSHDGTCTGGRLGLVRTLVFAETKAEADAICASLGGVVGSYNLRDIGFSTLPTTAWLCAGAPV